MLVMVPHIVAGTRLFDLLPLLDADHRVHAVFTVPEPLGSWQATHAFLERQGGIVLPWAQARRIGFDLVLAASTRGIDDVTGPVMLVPHGGGLAQYRPWQPPAVHDDWRPVLGLGPDQLLREGKVRADAIVLTHDLELEVLTRACPQAARAAVVAGNIAFDRLVASVGLRAHYRRALGVAEEQKLVVVSTTWSTRSAFGRHPDLFERVLTGLPPDRYKVVGLLHPQIWSHHGRWQIHSWLADCLDAGLGLLPPEEGWRAALAAADYVIGDYGSVTTFAAGAGVPVLLTPAPDVPLLAGSPAAVLSGLAPRWSLDMPVEAQLRGLDETDPVDRYSEVRSLLTSLPGQAGTVLRQSMYRLLGLDEPVRAVPASPVPLPTLITS